jgi:hypothetical protein
MPGIIIKNKKKKEKTCILIDVAIPMDKNVMQKKVVKKLKYKSLCIDVQQMWNTKCMIILVITGATGIITNRFKEKFGCRSRKKFNRFATKDITHNMERTTI